uniref:Ptk1 n=1 Tax=Arundo donax TaxID=35708 RepID=A0A0A9HAY5_ARUDO
MNIARLRHCNPGNQPSPIRAVQAVQSEIAIRIQSKPSFNPKTFIRSNKWLLVGEIT